MPIRVSSNILSHGTITGESIVALAIRPRMKFMPGEWHKSRNFSAHHIDLRPKAFHHFGGEAFVEIIGKFIIFIRRKIVNELYDFFVFC